MGKEDTGDTLKLLYFLYVPFKMYWCRINCFCCPNNNLLVLMIQFSGLKGMFIVDEEMMKDTVDSLFPNFTSLL